MVTNPNPSCSPPPPPPPPPYHCCQSFEPVWPLYWLIEGAMARGLDARPSSPRGAVVGLNVGERMPSAPSRPTTPESPPMPVASFSDLRSVRWRINLGVLPSDDYSVEELRRVTADTRRSYASLRRRLLVDPHVLKDEVKPLDLAVDNPLSQNPDSMWGQFFKNVELERLVDQDLSRLYPEQGSSYFQTFACQAILRRILLLWTLKHPDYGYRQGMHELLAPLLYVLHIDVQHLSQVRELYQDAFIDKFDDTSFADSKLTFSKENFSPNHACKKEPGNNFQEDGVYLSCGVDELEPGVKTIVLLNDAYGTEGELGVLLSERFMEHDAYCMFDALMSGANGMVALADFFSPSPIAKSLAGLPSVIEASFAIYHSLSMVDSSLHSHLVELGVEPQYFSMRWLRVLYGREFTLENLLVVWDEIFASSNERLDGRSKGSLVSHYDIFNSARGNFIISISVAMLLHLRSSLLATEHATSCLQKLLNFPESIELKKLIEKAKSLQGLALDSSISVSFRPGLQGVNKSSHVHNFSSRSVSMSPRTSASLLPDCYWEEKWRVLHKEDELHQNGNVNIISSGLKIPSCEKKSNLSRAVSTPLSTEASVGKFNVKSSTRRSLFEEFSQVRGEPEEHADSLSPVVPGGKDFSVVAVKDLFDDLSGKKVEAEDESCCGLMPQEGSPVLSTSKKVEAEDESCCGLMPQEGSPVLSTSSSSSSHTLDHDSDPEKCSSVQCENGDEGSNYEELPSSNLPHDSPINEPTSLEETESDLKDKQSQDRKSFPARFSWLLRFGRRDVEGTSTKGGQTEVEGNHSSASNMSRVSDISNAGSVNTKSDSLDKNRMGTLRTLGQSMFENIQAIEHAFQQDQRQSRNLLIGKGQVTVMAALKELRKISNILSEM